MTSRAAPSPSCRASSSRSASWWAAPPRQLRRRLGETFDFDASHVHRMRQDDTALAVSIHAYSPPLWRMGAYEVDADGTLRRRSISSAEELRPVETAA